MERAELIELLRATGCAEEASGCVFLCDPKWGAGERDALALAARGVSALHRGSEGARGWLCLPTGGTTGGVRFARHDEQTLSAAVRGFREHFRIDRVNAVDVLPPFHVSGLMARVRCAATAGEHLAWEWKQLEAGRLPELDKSKGDWVISLVPYATPAFDIDRRINGHEFRNENTIRLEHTKEFFLRRDGKRSTRLIRARFPRLLCVLCASVAKPLRSQPRLGCPFDYDRT